MKKQNNIAEAAGISDQAVRRATGKSWNDWVAILDRFGVREQRHQLERSAGQVTDSRVTL